MPDLPAATSIFLLSFLAESLVEYMFKPWLRPEAQPEGFDLPDPDEQARPPNTAELQARAMILRYAAALVGVLLTVLYRVDLLAMFGLVAPWPFVGWIITGFIIGRGSNYVHDFAGRWLVPTPPSTRGRGT